MERYELGACLYTSKENGVWLYHALDKMTNQPVILKYVQVPDAAAMDILRKEGDNQLRLNKHPNICKIYDFFSIADSSTASFLVLSLERCPQDMEKLWMSRSQGGELLDQNYLWWLLFECIEALAYAQDFVRCKQDICHRDIKPPNVLLGEDGQVRICDFGSSKSIEKAQSANPFARLTLQGTPQFLSPLLHEGLQEFLDSRKLPKVHHDPYKSDVYSLGYTFLVVSLLRYPVLGKNDQGAIWAEVQKLNYSDSYKQMIYWMMAVEEENRPDFQQLRSFFRPFFLPYMGSPDSPISSCIIHHWHPRSTDSTNPPIVLTCSPTHIICSAQCFREFVFTSTRLYVLEVDAVVCPVCKVPASPALIHQAYGGESEFEAERGKLRGICACGSENYVKKRFECSHRFCRDCWRRGGRPHFCPECRAPVIPRRKQCEIF